DFTRNAGEPLPELHVHPVLPVRVPESSTRGSQQELARYEEVVGDGVRREMRQIAQRDRPQPLRLRGLENLLADVPVVTVTPLRHVLLGQRYVRGDRTVEEVLGIGG